MSVPPPDDDNPAAAAGSADGRPPALQGIRVLDLSQGVAGPYATLLMAAQGADVLKIEPPEGDWLRHARNQVLGQSPGSLAVNAGKRSLAIDLKRPEAIAALRSLAQGCDIVVESFRPGVVERLGLDAQTLRRHQPGLIYCSVSGFGRASPLASRAVIDHLAQAYSGWMVLNADSQGVPRRTRNVVLADQVTGLFAYQAVASALVRRLRFGSGAQLEVTLVGSMAAFLAPRIVSHVLSNGRVGTAEFLVPTGDYPTAEGTLMLAVLRPADVQRLFEALGRADWGADPRFATAAARLQHADELRAMLVRVLSERSARDWESVLCAQGVMACAVRNIGEFLRSQLEDGLDLVESVDLPGLPQCPLVRVPGAPSWAGRARTPRPPRLGEHSREILAEAALDDAQIDRLLAPPPPTPSLS